MFVGAAGCPYAAFRRAIEARNLTRALTEARDLPNVSLADAAELVVLAADQRAGVFDVWTSRWAARYALKGLVSRSTRRSFVLAALSRSKATRPTNRNTALIAIFKARRRPSSSERSGGC